MRQIRVYMIIIVIRFQFNFFFLFFGDAVIAIINRRRNLFVIQSVFKDTSTLNIVYTSKVGGL